MQQRIREMQHGEEIDKTVLAEELFHLWRRYNWSQMNNFFYPPATEIFEGHY